MGKEVDRYTYRVTWSEEDEEYVGLCAECPSLSWLEASPEKALSGIRKVVKETVVDLKKSKDSIPDPISNVKHLHLFQATQVQASERRRHASRSHRHDGNGGA